VELKLHPYMPVSTVDGHYLQTDDLAICWCFSSTEGAHKLTGCWSRRPTASKEQNVYHAKHIGKIYDSISVGIASQK